MTNWDAGMSRDIYGRLPSDLTPKSVNIGALPAPAPDAQQPSASSPARPKVPQLGRVPQHLQGVRLDAYGNVMQAPLSGKAPPPALPAPRHVSGVVVATPKVIAILLKLVKSLK